MTVIRLKRLVILTSFFFISGSAIADVKVYDKVPTVEELQRQLGGAARLPARSNLRRARLFLAMQPPRRKNRIRRHYRFSQAPTPLLSRFIFASIVRRFCANLSRFSKQWLA